MIAYEIPLGLGILGVVISTGSLRLENIIFSQAQSGVWNAFTQPLGLVVFVVASFAEAARLPFDLPECEQELIGGYHTEYSGMRLLLFLIAEFLHMVVAAFLIVMLFFGGWHVWGMPVPADDVISWPVAVLRIFVLRDQGDGRDPVFHARPLELAAISLRSIDEPGMEGHAADGAGEPGRRGGGGRVSARARG